MWPFLLPVALVASLWTSPILASTPTSRNDPFRAITLQIPRKSDLPVCCLKQLIPPESVEDEIFLSFEEWKAKQSVIQEQAKAKEKDTLNRSSHGINGSKGPNEAGNGSELASSATDIAAAGYAVNIEEATQFQSNEAISPHLRVPLSDRFNYANLDCSARVHASHRSAKSTSSILSSKRDRYMLSPCNSEKKEKQFVVVELCEDIRIDLVQLANFEFFSGVFKDFTISVAKTYTTNSDEWTLVGAYRAKNVRGVQSFHPPGSLRDFYRYIRIDFLSHYSNEFYCPVSLLRVYGLTHLEQYMWEDESIAKQNERPKVADHQVPSSSVETNVGPPSEIRGEGITEHDSSIDLESPGSLPTPTDSTGFLSYLPTSSNTAEVARVSSTIYSNKLSGISVPNTSTIKGSVTSTVTPATSSISFTNDTHEHLNINHHTPTKDKSIISSNTISATSSSQTPNNPSSLHQTGSSVSPPSGATSMEVNSSSLRYTSPPVSPSPSSVNGHTTAVSMSSFIPGPSPVTPPLIPATTGGESIYRTIMNRLTALEANHTLYTRYVEQQTSGIRDVLKRLGEDVGRLEGIERAQTVILQRTINNWERRQQKLQLDYGELMARVEYLSDEIVLEKRLGIAQLCLLLAVLIFMGLTRGSRGEHVPVQLNKSVKEWGRRHLSFSGDWTTKFRNKERDDNGNLPKPHPESAKPLPMQFHDEDMKIEFPTKGWKQEPFRPADLNISPTLIDPRSQPRRTSRSRTPSLRSRHYYRPMTPTPSIFRPRIQRSNSQGGLQNGSTLSGGITAPRSAKRWARTAHLHEVRNEDRKPRWVRHGGTPLDGENEIIDVFSNPIDRPNRKEHGPGRSAPHSRRKGKSSHSRHPILYKTDDGEGDPWVDTDYSVDEPGADWDVKLGPGPLKAFSGNEY